MLQRHQGRVAAQRRALAPSRQRVVKCDAAHALIVNTKSGGHAFIGYYLAKALRAQGHRVTILNDGNESKVSTKPPFSNYHELTREGVDVAFGNPADPKTYPVGRFDVVYDNNGKDLESCKPLIDAFKGRVDHYVFVASAGAYKANSMEPMHVEGDARKSSAGHVEVEKYLQDQGLPYTVFQPLYIYGPLTAKDCEQWFIDRIIRDRPVPIPAPGIQLTSLTHVEDVAAMLAAVPGNRQAVGQQYNVCSDRAITFAGICKAVGKALGKEPKIVLYDPIKIGMGKSGKADGFPFRTIHFFASSDKAKRELGWQPQHTFLDDVEALVADYQRQGRQNKTIDFSTDDKILEAIGYTAPAHSSSSSSSNGNGAQSSAPAKSASAPLRRLSGSAPFKPMHALIVNCKSGGHAFIGYYLAKQLRAKGHNVTIMNDGEQSKVTKKTPFSNYGELERDGVSIAWGNPSDPSTYPRGTFDVVYDNNGKDMEACKPLIDTFKGRVSHYVFVASAGAYKANSMEPMHVEGDARKSSAGHVEVEKYLQDQGLPYTVFQPLYIYGPLTAKDCEQWFVDRVIRDRPVPIPAPGIQLTSLTHVEDVAAMLAAVPGNELAIGQHYNVCSDRVITFQGIVKAVGKALNKDPKIVLYQPEELGLGKSGKADGFPFRTIHFFASSDKAKRELGWEPKHSFLDDVTDLVADYQRQGRQNKSVDFAIDDKILTAVRH